MFCLAEWHSLAKLRLHSNDSLEFLDQSLKSLSKQLQHFINVTCTAFETKELPSEAAARQRQQQAQAQKDSVTNIPSSSTPRVKRFNMLTYKFHALADYINTIKAFGTTDSYTTQIVRKPIQAMCLRFDFSTHRESFLTVSSRSFTG